MKEYNHTTVLLDETVNALNVRRGELYIDCTTGGGGHSLKIAERGGRLVCFDVDGGAVEAAKSRLKEYDVKYINANFADMAKYIDAETVAAGIVMDLGVSSPQLDIAERGFSFHGDAPLDMRMGGNGITAYEVVNGYTEERITEILYRYGEEKYARSIARGIAAARKAAPVKSTGELAEIIRNNVPISVRNAKNPCRKTFQAVRIEVNDELGSLSRGLEAAFALLGTGGRLAVITFHSLEDRLVKKKFAELTEKCSCPKTLPLCVCGKTPQAKPITRKPITPSEEELTKNRRARSAKLRVIEKI